MSPAVYARVSRQTRAPTMPVTRWNPASTRERGRSWDIDIHRDMLGYISAWRSGRNIGSIR